jgi:RNA polymerase sigma-70 factor (ECF subfamily)
MAAAEFPTQAASHPRFSIDSTALPDSLTAFVSVRPRLFAIAYRMLRSVPEAEDVLQDVWLRWQAADRSLVVDAPAFLATTTTRLCINLCQSARSRRETCAGPWVPEPVDTTADPALLAERGEALKLAVLMLLEKLCPAERAAYVLREAFDYSYCQIASLLQKEEANIRQLVSRARKRIADGRRAPVTRADQERLLGAFIAAARKGNVSGLEDLFASDVASGSDVGGLTRAARIPMGKRGRVLKFFCRAPHCFVPQTW